MEMKLRNLGIVIVAGVLSKNMKQNAQYSPVTYSLLMLYLTCAVHLVYTC